MLNVLTEQRITLLINHVVTVHYSPTNTKCFSYFGLD